MLVFLIFDKFPFIDRWLESFCWIYMNCNLCFFSNPVLNKVYFITIFNFYCQRNLKLIFNLFSKTITRGESHSDVLGWVSLFALLINLGFVDHNSRYGAKINKRNYFSLIRKKNFFKSSILWYYYISFKVVWPL